uniref:Uncharacterized protein n=1 Tax=Moniliophthora roreri TaxID=221103 RepID=A0A0W0FXW8_MONRR
MIGLRVDLVEI